MPRIVLANWKASLAPERALAWCDSFSAAYTPRTGLEVVLAVPALIMDRVHQRIGALAGVSLAAQPKSGSLTDGNAMVTRVGQWLLRNLSQFPAGRCPQVLPEAQ